MKRTAALALLSMTCGGMSTSAEHATAPTCPDADVTLRVLGSGGPILDDDRASSGYAILLGGEPRLLVDAGPGVPLRLAQAGIDPRRFGGLLVSHVHVDHSAGLPAILKSASFSNRSEPLPVVGPTGDGRFPPVGEHLAALVGEEGAWRYLRGYLGPDGQPFRLQIEEVDPSADASSHRVAGLHVDAVGVPHGPVPALGFVVTAGDVKIAFTGDQRMDDPRFLELARGADLLVAHHAIPEHQPGVAARLHARPSQIGRLAHDAGVGRVILSHHMRRSLARLDENLAAIGAHYEGPVEVADDLQCFAVD